MSNARQETIADIVASKRSEAQYIRENNDTLIGRKDALKLEEEAGRIEAAWKREREAALSDPPRNCDVGTAEKQAERFDEYCDSESCKRNRCKSRAKALYIERCAIAWAQMPYEEGCAK